ncbi:MAG: hypothetical protein IH594_07900, partial [Bacteroidales bacterium]|nr:hypothetical protein [Bacteroidales bacterium]
MKTSKMFLFLVLVLFSGCKGDEPVKTVTLSFYTPYQDIPEKLNGQIKSVKEMNYWAIEKNGNFEPGELITRKDRDSLQWSSDFTAYFN